MLFTKATVVALAAVVSAAPTTEKRANLTDADILQYALTLEHLEDTLYREGLAKYSAADFARAGLGARVYANLQAIARDEAAHVDFLSKALRAAGVTPTAACTYDFGHVDARSFVATAAVLEGVGVSAYLGAAAAIMSRDYLTAAGSILTVEARHSAYLRADSQRQRPFAQPFDTPLSPDAVFSLASAFIRACPPSNPKLPVRAFPALEVAGGMAVIRPGDEIVLKTKARISQNTKLYAAFFSVTGPVFVDVTASHEHGCFKAVVPADGFGGQTYAVLTSSKDSVDDDVTVAGPAIMEISE